ncbi:hypothetical protein DFH11DRAFT_452261 [Phellopilus nigrolimitatus]|nr:hypothetical protein DFH11DRAFT_452261 [Phellopilus nigrolimitatus]
MAFYKGFRPSLSVENAASSAQRLPPEIIREIFLACLARDSHSLSSHEAPWNVSQTCRYWRDVALATQKLWAFLHYDSSKDVSLQMFELILDTWLLRSGSLPLHYKVGLSIPENSPDRSKHDIVERIVEALFQHQSRWRNVCLQCYGLDISDQFNAKATSMPQIEYLQLRFNNSAGEAITLDLSSALSIKELQLMSIYAAIPISNQLTNLRSVELHFSEPERENHSFVDVCLELLHAAPNLEIFELELYGARSSPPQLMTPKILLPHLRSIYVSEFSDITLVLEKLTAPALTSFATDSEHVDAAPVFLDFIRRSQPPLTVLDIWKGFASEEHLLEALRFLPALEVLEIRHTALSVHFLEALTVGEDQQAGDTLCPSLRRITVSDITGWEDMDGLVARMLLSRWTISKPLTEFYFKDVDCDMEKVIGMESIQCCIEEGLTVEHEMELNALLSLYTADTDSE